MRSIANNSLHAPPSKPGGWIRLATPSLTRIAGLARPDPSEPERRYVRWSLERFQPEADAELPSLVVNHFFRGWGHQFIYDAATLRHTLERAGFVEVAERAVGESPLPELAGLEHHGQEIGDEFNRFETFVLEARRPPVAA